MGRASIPSLRTDLPASGRRPPHAPHERAVMSLRVCAPPGCPALIESGVRDGRCAQHRRAKDLARGTASARGYGRGHRALRTRYQRRMDAGETFTCWRCQTRIDPAHWQLGLDDDDRSRYVGPECVPCNAATAGRQPRAANPPLRGLTGYRGGDQNSIGCAIDLNAWPMDGVRHAP